MPVEASKSWTSGGDYNVRVKAKDDGDLESGWSENHTISIMEGPQLQIGNIVGGLFKVKVPIKNIGSEDAEVSWSITLEGGAFIGKKSTGSETIFSGSSSPWNLGL